MTTFLYSIAFLQYCIDLTSILSATINSGPSGAAQQKERVTSPVSSHHGISSSGNIRSHEQCLHYPNHASNMIISEEKEFNTVLVITSV